MWRAAVLLGLSVLLLPATSVSYHSINALDPVEVYADGFGDLRGIALDDHGNVFVADRERGTLTRIAPDRSYSVVASSLERPIGLALDHEGRLLAAEERGGRVVRVEPDGRQTTLVTGVKRPRWLAVADDGAVFVSARRPTDDTEPAPADPDDESVEPETILVLRPNGTLGVFADGFKNLQGLATSFGTLFAATQGLRGDARVDGVVYRIPILQDGSAGAWARLGPADRYKKPVGLARDVLGALYVTTTELDLVEDKSKRAVAKLHLSGTVTSYAENLDNPQGAAFDADGNLYVADGSSGRVLRFRAPPAPAITSPDMTNQSPYAVAGKTVPGARVDLFVNDAVTPVIVTADATGAFAALLSLTPNAPNLLDALASSHGGLGLTSSAVESPIVHDGVAPALSFQTPQAGAYVRGTTNVQARATDAGTGVQAFTVAVDAQALSVTVAPALPAASATAAVVWNTLPVGDGPHTLGATASDRTANIATALRVVIVDNTPPDTRITDGPSGTVGTTTAAFSFTGTDNLTPAANLAFAWRLDGGAWSAFGKATTASLTNLTPGPHTFEVKAQDLAGNEDPTPARRAFTASSGALRITITDPADGATVPAGELLVRGIFSADAAEIGVIVNGVVAAVQDGVFAASVPVAPATMGPLVLTAVGTLRGGGSNEHSVAVTVAGSEPSLLAMPQSGPAPLTVSFSLGVGPGATVALDADGDGTADLTGSTLESLTFTYSQPGLYFPVAMVTDAAGWQTAARTVVQVHDRAAVDLSLKAKWSAMKSALVANDLAGAVSHFAPSQQARYQALFTALAADMAQIARSMQDIELIYVIEDRAKYRLPRAQFWGGQFMTLVYYVYFVRDADGLWAIETF